jgi:hypothetical protein
LPVATHKPITQEEQPQQEKLLCCGVADNKITQASTFEVASLPTNNKVNLTKLPSIASRGQKPTTRGELTQQEEVLSCGAVDHKK